MPLSPPDEEILALYDKVNELVKSWSTGNQHVRKDLLVAARSLYLAIETPMEAVLRMGWAEQTLSAALQIATNLDIFDQLSEKPSLSTTELANRSRAHPQLLGRILRHLAAMGIIKEVGLELYAHTKLSKAFREPIIRDGVTINQAGLIRWLAQNDYQVPQDPSSGPFQIGLQTDLEWFGWLEKYPQEATQFNNHMAGYSMSRARWFEHVPLDTFSLTNSENDVLLVDIGGGDGHDIVPFKKYHPNVVGRLILQDQPNVIDGCKARLPAGIAAQAHDFFKPQPVKAASMYYLHSVLHDWTDKKCTDILLNIASAMKRGRSKILINENVILDRNNHWETTGLDLMMMSIYSSKERTETDWHRLLNSAGLQIIKIWNYERGTESLIEAELV